MDCALWSDKLLEIGATVKIFILEPSIKILSIAEPDFVLNPRREVSYIK
jgi:hypothetical protein